MKSFGKVMKNRYKEEKKSAIIIYFILRILVIICGILALVRGDYRNAFICVLALLLFTLPTIAQKTLNFELPNTFEAIVYFFIFAAEILGDVNRFYVTVPHFDTILHTMNGFLCAAVGFGLVDLLNKKSKKIEVTPLFIALVAFCFSMTIGVLWEFFEYAGDQIFIADMQKDTVVSTFSTSKLDSSKRIYITDIIQTEIKTESGETYVIENGYLDIGINDTMKDLIVNMIGAIVFCIFGVAYLKNERENAFATKFIPHKFVPKKLPEKIISKSE